MSERRELNDAEEMRDLELMMRDDEVLEKKLRENARMGRFLSVGMVVMGGVLLVMTFAFDGSPRYEFLGFMFLFVLWSKITSEERSRLLLMKVLRGEHGEDKGDGGGSALVEPCGAVSGVDKTLSGADVVVPDMGLGETTYRLVRWMVKDGDEVNKGQNIAFIETDKATLELESSAAGTLSILQEEGAEVGSGAVIGRVE